MAETPQGFIEAESITHRISRSKLPSGLHWEPDGACWEAVEWEPHPVTGQDWRWRPMNFKAFAKEEPQGEMLPYAWAAFEDQHHG